jgi:hypothetical protein
MDTSCRKSIGRNWVENLLTSEPSNRYSQLESVMQWDEWRRIAIPILIETVWHVQGDQAIGRIIAHWATLFLGAVFHNFPSSTHFLTTIFLGKSCRHCLWQETSLTSFWAGFFTNTSGHREKVQAVQTFSCVYVLLWCTLRSSSNRHFDWFYLLNIWSQSYDRYTYIHATTTLACHRLCRAYLQIRRKNIRFRNATFTYNYNTGVS